MKPKERTDILRTEMWVMTHKSYPGVNDNLYRTLHVGRAISEDLGYQGDNTGDNISLKNKNYCELTGLYWLWKNHDCDIIGICHYRRFFVNGGRILTREYIEKTLEDYDIIIPANGAVNRDTVKEHYADRHFGSDLEVCRQVIAERYPEYAEAFEYMQNSRLMNFCNMLVAKKQIYDEYCTWLFDVLFEVERRIDISGRDDYQKRVFGFLSERLIKVWLLKNEYRVKEKEVEMMDSDETDKQLKLKELVRSLLQRISSGVLKVYKDGRQQVLPPVKNIAECAGRTPVWICCWQGVDGASEIEKKCIDSVKRHIDERKCELHIITLGNCFEYVQFSPEIICKFNSGKISPHILSERLCMELLYRYGGLWINPMYFVCSDRINRAALSPGLYFLNSGLSGFAGACDFIKGDAGFPLFGFIMEAFDEYFRYKDEPIAGYMADYFFDIAYENLDLVCGAVDMCEINNSDTMFFINSGNRLFDVCVWNEITQRTWLFKLSDSQQYRDKNIVGRDTFYGRIIERNNNQV